MKTLKITASDGTLQDYDASRIKLKLLQATTGLPSQIEMVATVAKQTELTLFNKMTTEQLTESLVNAALQNIKDDPDYDNVASYLMLDAMYKKNLGEYKNESELKKLHTKKFPEFIKWGVQEGLLTPELTDGRFDLDRLAAALDPQKDKLSKYLGVVTNASRYALRKGSAEAVELPQYTHMRIAMGMSLNEKDPTKSALDFYHHMSNLHYVPGGSTRVNAGGAFPQLSNCFLINVDDDMESIAKSVRDTMFIAKGTGGIGIGFTKLRAAGSPVKTTNTESTGPIPFMKMIDTALFAVSRKGKKAGAAALYMENWHINFPQFLDLRSNSGDPYFRTRFANIAVFMSDEFMRRVKNDEDWYMFDPADVMDLTELYGDEFAKRYNYYIKQADKGKIKRFEKTSAREQFRQMLIQLQATAHPWLTWKDTINVRALNNNTGTIHLSNLCTEITLPQDNDNISVCNLVSINLSAFLDPQTKKWDFTEMEASVRSAIRQLDNLVDITKLPVPEAMHANSQTRALGLGFMGLSDVLEKMGYSYESEEAYDLVDELAEFISYYAIDESANLAQKLGSYPSYKGSGWDLGILPIDTIDLLEKDRGEKVKISRARKKDWEKLRKKVKKGMRNATVMAIAPTANIGHIAGTTPGIDPQFSQIFSRSTLNGKFLEINKNLVNQLKEIGIWDEVKEDLLVEQGDVQNISQIPQKIKDIYKTSFQLSPYAFIEVAGRAQKWVDQAISRNIYLETRDIDEYEKIYMEAWKRGLKTTYYLHVKPRHQSEQQTISVEKVKEQKVRTGGSMGGFSFAKKK